jgi:hypothetical protein
MIINGVPVTLLDLAAIGALAGLIVGSGLLLLYRYLNTHLPGPPGHAEWVDESTGDTIPGDARVKTWMEEE